MTRCILLALLAPLAAQAQLVLVTFDGTTETPVGSTYNYGNVAAGANQDIRFRARTTGSSAINLTTLSVSGTGFTILGAPATAIIAPTNFLEFTVRFSALVPASYSANLQLNAISVILIAAAVPAPTLNVLSGCTQNPLAFMPVQFGKMGLCNFSIANTYSQPLTISNISLTGSGLQLTNVPSLPAVIAPGVATTFTVQVIPVCGTTNYSGTLTVNTQSYSIIGTAFLPPLALPVIGFDPGAFASGQQRNLTMNLPTAFPCPALASGLVNLAFTPNTTVVTDDPTVLFVARSTRKLPFSLASDGTHVLIDSQTAAVFNTGTTQGKITFTVTTTGIQINGDPTTSVTIPPAAVSIDTALASNQRLGELDIEVIGYDNTYTAGTLSFAFLDTSGKPIGEAIAADFSSQFKTYFTSVLSGSSFLMRVSFPVTGNQYLVGTVAVTLTNAAGTAQTGSLTFQ